jgi:hypothetical protein
VDKALTYFTRRRLGWCLGTAGAVGAALLAVAALRTAFRPAALGTGLLLYGLVVGLALFNTRKKFPFLPLTSAATWLQIHIYAGWFSVVLFFIHTRGQWPQGLFQQVLAAVFLLVAFSGAFGLCITRWLPGRLTHSGEALTYERIPEIRAEIRIRVEAVIATAESTTGSSTLADYYLIHLSRYLNGLPGIFAPFAGPARTYLAAVGQLDALDRYFNAREREVAAELRDWIEAKRNLDAQLAGQRLLKLWLFIHIPASCSLLLLGLVHGLIALNYAGRF